MVGKGLSVQSWPSGHQYDSEEALAYTELENVDCMVQTWPLDKAQEAYGMQSLPFGCRLLTFYPRGNG